MTVRWGDDRFQLSGDQNDEVDEMFTCECCERPIVPAKLAGIGYICDDCLATYVDESGYPEDPHWPVCPFKVLPPDPAA